MKTLIKFPSIEQFRNTVYAIKQKSEYTVCDENNEPVFDETKPKPVLTFTGTVKLHGTSAGVNYSLSDGVYAQSRESLLEIGKDNAGFAGFVEQNKEVFHFLFLKLALANGLEMDDSKVFTIYGEWVGIGIQKGVGISKIPKSFFVFAAKVTEGENSAWLDSSTLASKNDLIFNIEEYVNFTYQIDFNSPADALPHLTEITNKIEECCPVAFAFGVEGIGEGVVWKTDWEVERYFFKVKGEKHSVAKGEKIVSVDTERVESVDKFVTYAVTENRFNQAISTIFGDPKRADVKRLGEVMKWMNADIEKEESDTLANNGLTMKEVNGAISNKARKMFFALNEL